MNKSKVKLNLNVQTVKLNETKHKRTEAAYEKYKQDKRKRERTLIFDYFFNVILNSSYIIMIY